VPTVAVTRSPINRDALTSVLERVGQLAIGGDDRDVRASSFLFQRISVVGQQFNSVLLHKGFTDNDHKEYRVQCQTCVLNF